MPAQISDQDSRASWPLSAMSGEGVMGPSRSATPGDSATQDLRGRNVLVVEDESLIALLITDALEEAGASVIGPCYTLSECVSAVRGEGIDAAIVDVDLAGEDVFPAAEELRRRKIPFVFHTAHGEREELQSRFGGVPVCRKPVDMDELVKVVVRIAGANPAN